MNKSDIKLIIIIIIIVSIVLIILNINKGGNIAVVYYQDEIIKKIDLNKDGTYTVAGYLGDVVLEVKDKKIKVVEENSNNHICSKEGYIKDSSRSLICMPNKIIIKIIDDKEVDEVVY